MTGPSNAQNRDWKWRKQINIGRLEAMIEVRDWLAGMIWVENPKFIDPAIFAVVADIHLTIAANCERGGKWASSIPMKKK